MPSLQRVVVTGLGTVNALGSSVDTFWANCVKGTSGVRKVTNFPIPETMSQIAGIADSFDPSRALMSVNLPPTDGEQFDRSLLFAFQAVAEALDDAGLTQEYLADRRASRPGVYISSAISHIQRMEDEFRRQSEQGSRPIVPEQRRDWSYNCFFFNSTSAEVARRFGIPSGYATIATGCTGGVDAVGYAIQSIRYGSANVVITGAAEAPITPLVVASFSKIGATSLRNHAPTCASRPFDVGRDGFVLAEGCGILILESLEHALERGAHIYAEISGFGSVNSCYHMTAINPDGVSIARSCQQALIDAQVSPDQVDFVNLHGSSTPQNDVAEANALRFIFGERSSHIPVTSLKSQTGHSLSAANSIELIGSVLSIRDGVIPPTINLEQQDEQCPLDVVNQEARKSNVTCVLKTSSGFSGIHSSLIVQQYPGRSVHHPVTIG